MALFLYFNDWVIFIGGFLVTLVVKNLPANAGDVGSILGLERSPWEANGNPPQYSCLENPMDRGAWQTIVPGSQRIRHDLEIRQYNNIHYVCVCVSHLRHPGICRWTFRLFPCLVPSHFSHVWPFVTSQTTVAHPTPLSMGFSRHEYWSGLPLSSLVSLSWLL